MDQQPTETVWDELKDVFCAMQCYHKKALWLIAVAIIATPIIWGAVVLAGVHVAPQTGTETAVGLIFQALTVLGMMTWVLSSVLLVLAYFTDRSPAHTGKLLKKFAVTTMLLLWILAAGGVDSYALGNFTSIVSGRTTTNR